MSELDDYKLQTQIKIMRTLYLLLICLFITPLSYGYPPCSTIQMGQYYFDLSSLSSIGTSLIQMGSTTVALSFCGTDSCNGANTFLKKKTGSVCQSFSRISAVYLVNETVLDNYQYIDDSTPSVGLQINYLPLITTTTSTATVANQTVNATTTTSYLGILYLYCNSGSSKAATCVQQTNVNTNTTLDSKNNSITTSSNVLRCSYYHASGCPILVVNQFNAFISKNLIWLSVVIWIVSLFQLLLGYFVIRLTIFLFGVASGTIFGLIYNSLGYANYVSADDGLQIAIFILILSILMGILFGISLLTLPKLGYVNIGLWVALIFSLLLQNSVLYMTGSLLGFYITLGVSALIMMVLALLALRNFIILSTTFISAFGLVRPLGFFLPYYPNELTTAQNYVISSSATTQWQFYLYLISIAVITILGAAFQFCLYKKKGRDHGNKGYYLEEEGTLRDKMKRLLEFNQIRDLLKRGKDQVMFLKDLVVDDQSQSEQKPQAARRPQRSIQMQNITSANKSKLRQSLPQSPEKQKKPAQSSKKSVQQKRPTSKDKKRRPPSPSQQDPSEQESQEETKVVKKVVKTNRKK